MSEVEFNSKLSWLKDAIELGTSLTKSWFRGQSQTFGQLTPSAFRDDYREFWMGGSREATFTELFKRQAPAYSDFTPEGLDYLEWLFLMQHHGSPTRLLDWTENVLVALYFVVRDHHDKDGELWAMYPDELNSNSIDSFGISLTNSKYVKYLASEPFHNNSDQLKKDLDIVNDIKGPIAFYPPMRFPRMINQQSVFTIHTDPEESKTIPDLLKEEKYLVRYVIPRGRKMKLLGELHSLGVKENTLFPNLDSLSISIKHEMKTVAYSPPNPPKFHEV